MLKKIGILFWACALLLAPAGFAHQTSDSYLALSLTNNGIEGRWAISLRDLDHVLQIDENHDGEVSDSELSQSRSKVESYVFTHLKIAIGAKSVRIAPSG